MLLIGLNAYHGDASACLIRDGRVIAAAEEERFRRVKHWAGFPREAIAYCLDEAGVTISDVQHIAINSNSHTNLFRKLNYAIRNRLDTRMIHSSIINRVKRESVEGEIKAAFPGRDFRGQVHRIEHHLAHLASGFLVSPFKEASVISVDGFGDFASTAWGVGIGANIEVEGRIFFPHSLGIFYQALTQYLGFPNYGDEYKVMGLAPYGKPTYLSEMRNIVRLLDNGQFELETDYFRHHKEKIDYEWDGVPRVGLLYSPKLEELLGAARQKGDEITIRHCNIAHSVQLMYETAFFNLLNSLHAKHGIASLTIAGGCGMNSVANGKVILQTPFKRLYVQPAAGDAGGAIGAAVYLWHKIKNKSFADVVAGPSVLKGDQLFGRTVMDHAYFGPAASNLEISDLLKSSAAELDRDGCTVIQIENERGLCKEVAKALAAGEVVGWFQGRMEWGPRALGNRSILSDPRRIDMKELLNKKIKRREDFRPFAPSIQSEHAAEWFETDDDVPFMMQVYQIRKEKQKLIPAVAHVDGSGRLQMVYRETNQLYWELIEAFRELTGIPILLNTSFNENEPIVCRPVEALNCFRRTKMDRLVIGSYLIKRV